MLISSASLIAAFVSLGTTALICGWLVNPRSRLQIIDHPNERSLHERPTPRTGGIGIVIGIAMGYAGISLGETNEASWEMLWVAGAAVPIAIVSFLDDRRQLAVRYRLGAHLLGAALLVSGGFVLRSVSLPGMEADLPAGVAELATVLVVVWMTNLFNFMDGMDGFAAGMALFGFGTLSLLGGLADDQFFAGCSLVVAAAAAGFLLFNFPPSRIFMGDTGSTTLGFLAAGMALWGEISGIVPLWVSVLLFLPFVADATFTLARRLLRGDQVWQAHRSHFYQRLVGVGWSHRRTVLVEYGLMATCSAAAIAAAQSGGYFQWVMLMFPVGLIVVFFCWVYWLELRIR